MRVSTAQFYFQNSQQLTSKQSSVNEQVNYLSNGKRVLTAKDDAVAYGTLAGYKDELANIEKYQRNITQAENRNTLQETSFENAEALMQELKQNLIRANNGTLSDSDLKSLAAQVQYGQAQLLNIANSKDETGGYIFAGYNTDVQPFALQPDNSVTYQGDSGIRELQIAKNVTVATNQPGNLAFESVPNALGDFQPVYNTSTSEISINLAKITDPSSNDVTPGAGFPPPYNISFTSPTDLTITDADGDTFFSTNAYVPGQVISLTNGIELQISGNPLPGDSVDLIPQESISVFETFKKAVDWMESGASSTNSAQRQIDYNDILDQVDNALNHIISRRTEAGVRMQLIDNQESNHLDAELYLEKGRSNVEDLDFAKAVANFEQSKVALQAAQQTFIQVKDLNLFNFI
tara:strand:+ start:396 stop:1613 length:1218 start_codon:yes stop_codon:yes gene_type:complete